MSLKTRRSLFPLHLTPFESYMFVDDSARHPMTFVVEFEFSGEINRDKFQHAIDESLRRHPMLRSFVQPAKSNRDCWVSTAQYDSQVSWLGFSDPWVVEGTGEYINLREEIGFRCFVRSNTSRAIVTFIFHHSCCDGIGAYQFIGDVLWFYADAHGAVQPELPELNEMDLKQRLRANVNFELVQDAQSSPKIQHAIVNPVAQVQSLDRNEDETAQSTAAAPRLVPGVRDQDVREERISRTSTTSTERRPNDEFPLAPVTIAGYLVLEPKVQPIRSPQRSDCHQHADGS